MTDLSPVKGNRGPVRGPCRTCGVTFRSFGARYFCSMACYTRSPEFKARAAANNERKTAMACARRGLQPNERTACVCIRCRMPFTVPCLKARRQFCGKDCRRRYYAERFDRWVADPQSIALPQCYDEFFTREVLTCPIAGCTWEGVRLGIHANIVHGLTAERLRELMGCNRGTGLCTSAESAERSKVAKRIGLAAFGKHWPNGHKKPRGDLRLEAKEHALKARVLAAEEIAETPVRRICVGCGVLFGQAKMGYQKWCSRTCRNRFYRSPRFDLECAHCLVRFVGNAAQDRRRRRGKPVFCSMQCKQVRNSRMSRSSGPAMRAVPPEVGVEVPAPGGDP